MGTVEEYLEERDRVLLELKGYLFRAQQMMKAKADKHRRDDEFSVGDRVFLKLQPYRQQSVARRVNEKLSPRYFGPFEVLERVGQVAYRLKLPDSAKIHNIFHISQLKRAIGDKFSLPSLPATLTADMEVILQPDQVEGVREGNAGREVLIRWKDLPSYEATWESLAEMIQRFPDCHLEDKCEAVGRVADIIQIPAFLCRQTDLLVAAAKTGRIINIKKGQFCAPSVMVNSAEKIRMAGNENVMVCERGTMFGYNDLIVDPRNFEWMREANCPVVADITHSLQQPAGRKLEGGGVASGGLRELIPCIARTAVSVGVDGIFMEVHNDPLNAPVDGPTQWPLRHLEELLEELISIATVSKGKQKFQIDLTAFRP
ncbi:hypothetical protein OROGR_001282 [Orobanche gracilis]